MIVIAGIVWLALTALAVGAAHIAWIAGRRSVTRERDAAREPEHEAVA